LNTTQYTPVAGWFTLVMPFERVSAPVLAIAPHARNFAPAARSARATDASAIFAEFTALFLRSTLATWPFLIFAEVTAFDARSAVLTWPFLIELDRTELRGAIVAA